MNWKGDGVAPGLFSRRREGCERIQHTLAGYFSVLLSRYDGCPLFRGKFSQLGFHLIHGALNDGICVEAVGSGGASP